MFSVETSVEAVTVAAWRAVMMRHLTRLWKWPVPLLVDVGLCGMPGTTDFPVHSRGWHNHIPNIADGFHKRYSGPGDTSLEPNVESSEVSVDHF